MTRWPVVVGLVLCEGLRVDRATAKTSLYGLFNGLHFRTMPSPPLTFTVYAVLYDGVGEGRIKLAVTRLVGEQDIYVHERWLKCPGRFLPAFLEIRLYNVRFPAFGRYAFKLHLEDRVLTERLMDVYPE
jgi:hypothetical protein